MRNIPTHSSMRNDHAVEASLKLKRQHQMSGLLQLVLYIRRMRDT